MSPKRWNPFTIEQWIAWISATSVGVAGITSFFYVNFETRTSASEFRAGQQHVQDDITRRLERMEDKIDRILQAR